MKYFNWPLRVYYEDTDAAGVVYYANYLKFFERARTEYLRHLGFHQSELNRHNGVVFAVRSIYIDYLKPARFDDELIARAAVIAHKRASLDFEQQLVRSQEPETVLSSARVRIACLDAKALRPCAMPHELLERIKNVV